MNKKRYLTFCSEFNYVFRELSKNIDVLPCLNSILIIKENKQYYLNYYKKFNSFFFLILIPINLLVNVIFFIYHLASTIRLTLLNKKKIINKVDCIFLSHGFRELNYKDIYFNNIKKKINKKKIKFDTFYINQGKKNKLYKNKKLLNNKYLSTKDVYEITKKILINFFGILKLCIVEKNRKKKKILFYLLSNIISPSSLMNFLIVDELIKLLKLKKVKYLFYTFEGFAYEKYLLSKINKDKKYNLKTFGYQHTGLSYLNNSIINLTSKNSLPNYVLCISKVDQKILKKKFKTKRIIVIGKGNYDHIKVNKVREWKIKKNKIPYNCLILFENNHKEINKLLKNFNSVNNDIKFTIRSHPTFEKNLKKIFYLNKLKISKSKKNLIKDLSDNDIVIYKSSSVVFQSIDYGLFPIRIADDNLDENPLRKIVSRNEINNLNDIKNAKKLIKYNKYKSISSQCLNYSNNLDYKFLDYIK